MIQTTVEVTDSSYLGVMKPRLNAFLGNVLYPNINTVGLGKAYCIKCNCL